MGRIIPYIMENKTCSETTNQNIFQYHTDQWIIDNTHPSKDSEMQPKRGNKTSMDTFFVGYVTMYVCPPPCGCWSLGHPQFYNQDRWLPMKQQHGNPMNFHEISNSNNMKSPIFIHFPWCFHVGSPSDTPRGSNPVGFPRPWNFFTARRQRQSRASGDLAGAVPMWPATDQPAIWEWQTYHLFMVTGGWLIIVLHTLMGIWMGYIYIYIYLGIYMYIKPYGCW